MREKSMEKRREKTQSQTAPIERKNEAKFVGYVNFEWSDVQKEAFGIWVLKFNFWDELNAQTAKYRRISVGWDTYHQCYVASAFERDTDSPNAGYICTARGVDAATAVSRLLFLISELMPDEWVKPQSKPKQDLW